jgi:alkanesulfonate monooxygenase SsuD/methylene tetrahydromethanopterin reductase-like flavin-dependent oxidoreductase (luciferase family)
MEGGVSLIVRGSDATQQNLASMAAHAEAWGCDSVRTCDHLIIPALDSSCDPASNTGQFADSWLQRSFEPIAVSNDLAGCTTRLRQSPSVTILPMRKSMAVAKEGAGAHGLSGGGSMFGVGVGQRATSGPRLCAGTYRQRPCDYGPFRP